jgi:GT2 family glycosyltransferase
LLLIVQSEAQLGASGQNPARCYVLHDVDLLPENLANVYACLRQPRHMSVATDSLRYTLPYRDLVGGALAISADQFRTVNGFPTSYAGWGGEDDELSRRLRAAGFAVQRFGDDLCLFHRV